MTSTTIDTPTTPATPIGERVTATRVVISEWIKLRTLRSSWAILAAAVVAVIAIGMTIGYATSTADWAKLDVEDQAASAPLQGYYLAQLLLGVLGVLYVTGEYGTGMIRSTFAAVPKRLPVVAAKSAVYAAVVLPVMTAVSFVTFFSAQLFLSADGHGASLSDPGALRAIAGVGLYLTLVGVLGGALGWIVRSTAGAITALVGLLLVLPAIIGVLPGTLGATIGKFLPNNAGGSFASSVQAPDTLGPWTGLGVFVIWVAVALAAATVVVRRRDA